RHPELVDETLLDPAARVAGGDARHDELPDPVRDRRARLVEGRVAGRAHDLALELAQRRVALACRRAVGPQADGEHERDQRDGYRPHVAASASGMLRARSSAETAP